MQSDNVVTSQFPPGITHGLSSEGSAYSHVTTERLPGPGKGIGQLLCSFWTRCWTPTGPWSSKAIMILGIIQITLGVLHIIPQIILLNWNSTPDFYVGFFGIMFIVTGIFSIIACKKIDKCHVTILMLLCIVSLVLACVTLRYGLRNYQDDERDYMWENDETNAGQLRFVLAQHGLIMAFACAELITALVSIVFIGRSLRFHCGSTVTKTYLIQMPAGETNPSMVQVMVTSDLQSLTANAEPSDVIEKSGIPEDGPPPYTGENP